MAVDQQTTTSAKQLLEATLAAERAQSSQAQDILGTWSATTCIHGIPPLAAMSVAQQVLHFELGDLQRINTALALAASTARRNAGCAGPAQSCRHPPAL